jgi:LuxR family transcriptional regulator, maltose regulon positive regulatory protein
MGDHMDTLLLATKLRIPPQPHQTVRRARLIDAIEQGIPRYKLIQIAAPAGYGKTTLLAQWAHASRYPVAWLSIGAEDNDLDRFLRYLLSAWEQVQPALRESRLNLLLGGMSPDGEAVLSAFVNAAIVAPEHVVFVIDDYHLIEEPTIHQALAFLLEHQPPTMHFALAGRAEPALPLARYRARNELLELQTEDLQFLPDETSELLNSLIGLNLAPDTVAALHTQLEGWIAGLRLIALTLERKREAADTLAISGRQRFIADYLAEDVLAHLPAALRHFLLQTSILDHLCGPLCDATTGGQRSQELLERLDRENIFLLPLDDRREWFRYHRIFADFLQEQLHRQHPDQVTQLHRRAGRWYLAHDLAEQALQHAVAGDDAELALQIGEQYFEIKLLSGEIRLLNHWLQSLPAQWHSDYPLLGIFRAGVLLFSGALDAGARCLDEVEHGLDTAERAEARWPLARVSAVRCAIACFQNDLAQAETFAGSAFRDLPQEDYAFRAAIHHALGDTYRRNGRWEEARANYLDVLKLTHTPTFRLRSAHVFGALADLQLQQGRLRDSVACWHKALAVIQQPDMRGSFPLPLIGWVFIRLGEILYEWNQLEQAGLYVSQGLERAELGGDVRAMLAAYLLEGRLRLTNGDIAAAVACLDRARPLVENATFPEWVGRFERLQLECWLAQDRLRTAADWADARLRSPAGEGQLESEAARLAIARVLIVKGDPPALEQAWALADRLLPTATLEGRAAIQIEALTLQASADWQRGEHIGALTALERALRLAEPEGYLRLFADLGLPIARLLQEARSRAVLPDYVEKLLAAFDSGLSSVAVGSTLPEPLTAREQEILVLIAAGLTNREVAEQLVISAETVKKHTSSIYGKLGVSNRTQAASRAAELGLLA